jgi:hypothetical protein
MNAQPGVAGFAIPVHVVEGQPAEEGRRVRLGGGLAPIHFGAESLHSVCIELEDAISDFAVFQILEVLVRNGQRREVVRARRIADSLGDAEPAAALELFDVLHLLDVQTARRVHLDGAEHRNLL